MEGVILLVAVFVIFVWCFVTVKHFDEFLADSFGSDFQNVEKKEPSCVVLTKDMTDEEIMEEIQYFRRHHQKMEIYLCENICDDLTAYLNINSDKKH